MRRSVILTATVAVTASVLAWGAGPGAADPGNSAPNPQPAQSARALDASATTTFGFVGRATVPKGALESDAEVAAVAGSSLFVIDREEEDGVVVPGLRHFNITDPASPRRGARIDLREYGADINSVAAHGSYVAVAMQAEPKTRPGSIVLFAWNGRSFTEVGVAPAGALPDMVAFSPDGKVILAANEGEPDCYGEGCVDPEGSLTLINVGIFTAGGTGAVKQIKFTAFNSQRARLVREGVRIFGPGATVAQDLEPEYVAFDPANPAKAWVTLQENNAIAAVDLATPKVASIKALGLKLHNVAGRGLDASDRDNRVNVRTWPVRGMYMPDAIATYVHKGKTYVVSANEGDARDYEGFAEEVRVGSSDFPLNPAVFPDFLDLKKNENLGRLTVTKQGASTTGSLMNQILAFGARSISVWDPNVKLVWDSGDALETMTAARLPRYFNASNTAVAFDDRSDNKGPEPEGVAVGTIGDRTYAFVALERIGGLAVFDVTDPAKGQLVQYLNTRNFTTGAAPDSGAEAVSFVPADKSPNGKALVAVSNEVSGTVTLWQPVNPDGAADLTLLHNNDGESSLFTLTNAVGTTQLPVGSVAAFSSVAQREVAQGRARGNSVVTVYAGDSFLASALLSCSLPPAPASTPVYDAVAQRFLPYDVHVLGNHEFDFGPGFLKRYIDTFNNGTTADQPFISGNLDFSTDPSYASLIEQSGTVVGGRIVNGRVVAKSAVVNDLVTGQRFGVVSATTPNLATISSPAPVTVTTNDIEATATVVQAQVNAMKAAGISKIIFVSHLQTLASDKQMVGLLTDIDIAVAGGGDDQLANTPAVLLPGDPPPVGTYPLSVRDKAGVVVPIVTTSGNYKYLGRLDASFDAQGSLVGYDLATSYPRRVLPQSDAATRLGVTDAVAPDSFVAARIAPAQACLDGLKSPIARTEVLLNVARGSATALGVRTGETNGGDLVTDSFVRAYDTYAARAGLPARSAGNIVVAAQNGGGIRQNAGDVLPAGGQVPGPITRDNTLNVLAFFTNVMSVTPGLTAAEMKEIFERSVAVGLSGATCTGAGGGQFLQVSQLRLIADCSKTAQVVSNPVGSATAGEITTPGERVRYLAYDPGTPSNLADDIALVRDGVVVLGAPTVSLVTNSFTAEGGDNFPTLAKKSRVLLGLGYEQALVEYLLSFPSASGLPTVPSSDARYALPRGQGRITFG